MNHRETYPYAHISYYGGEKGFTAMGKEEEWTRCVVTSRLPMTTAEVSFTRGNERSKADMLRILEDAFHLGREDKRREFCDVLGVKP